MDSKPATWGVYKALDLQPSASPCIYVTLLVAAKPANFTQKLDRTVPFPFAIQGSL